MIIHNCKYVWRLIFFSLLICILPGLASIQSFTAEPPPEAKLEGKTIYKAMILDGINYEKAVEDLANILDGRSGSFGIVYFGSTNLLYFTGRDELGTLLMGGNRYAFSYDNRQKLIYVLFKAITLEGDSLILSPQLSVRLRDLDYQPVEVVKTSENYKYAIHAGMLSFHFKKEKVAKNFADLLCTIQKIIFEPTEEEQNQLIEFKPLALKYRELTIKPEMPEEQRKYVVQANTLTNMKDYKGAIAIYLKAVKIDPVSYPGAYTNLALLSAQLKRYDDAISYMEKYLMLVPDASDARGAQDKIYEWEIMKKKQVP